MKVRDVEGVNLYSLLLSTMRGKPFREENTAHNALVDRFTLSYGERKYNAVQWFFTNASKAVRNGYSGFSVKLKPSYWSGNICGIGARQVNSVLDQLCDDGYIILYKGSKDYKQEWLSYPSIVQFTQKLVDLFDDNLVELHVQKGVLEAPVVIKDRESKEEISIPHSEALDKMMNEINTYNNSLSKSTIEFQGKPVPLIEYKRSFSQDLFHGGRLFVHGGGIQILPQEYRLEYVTIEGENICELDYSSIHPNICYQMYVRERPELLDLIPKGFEPYDADSSFLQVDNVAIVKHKMKYKLDKYNPVRKLYKMALLLCINNKTFDKACQSLSYELHKDSQTPEKDRQYVGIHKPEVSKIVRALAEHNYLIEKEFYCDKGIWLQKIDSDIALRVIDLMIQNGETALCYHDSFAVKKSLAGFLEAAMMDAWKDVLGNNHFCKIDRK